MTLQGIKKQINLVVADIKIFDIVETLAEATRQHTIGKIGNEILE